MLKDDKQWLTSAGTWDGLSRSPDVIMFLESSDYVGEQVSIQKNGRRRVVFRYEDDL